MEYYPLTSERWNDFEELFGPKGAYAGCWCMWWRCFRKEFETRQGDGNRLAMKAIVESGKIPGIIAYDKGKPVGWCSVARREDYTSLERSRVLKRIDDVPVWSIVCFYISKDYRGTRMMEKITAFAIEFVRSQGGKVVEAYPTIPKSGKVPPVSSFMGFPSIFEKLGFTEAAQPSKSKKIMRYYVDGVINRKYAK